MNTYNVKELEDSVFFSDDVYVDQKFLFSIPEVAIDKDLKNILCSWSFDLLLSEGKPLKQFQSIDTLNSTDDNQIIISTQQKKINEIRRKQREAMAAVSVQYKDFLNFIQKIYDNYLKGYMLNVRQISDKAKDLCDFVAQKQKLILKIPVDAFADDYDYLTIHAIRSSIFAIIIGTYLKLPSYKLIELTAATLIHEVGMLNIPATVYNSSRPLRIEERQAILTHPILSYNAAKAASFSLPICLGCLEHHERENGSGYPRRLPGNRISFYGKIIAVACSFEAATGVRNYKEKTGASSALIELIRNENKQYDEKILKALLFSLSFYPIGLDVILSDGRMAEVVDVNPDDPRFPIVKIFNELSKDGNPKIIGTNKNSVYITREMTKEEISTLKQNELN